MKYLFILLLITQLLLISAMSKDKNNEFNCFVKIQSLANITDIRKDLKSCAVGQPIDKFKALKSHLVSGFWLSDKVIEKSKHIELVDRNSKKVFFLIHDGEFIKEIAYTSLQNSKEIDIFDKDEIRNKKIFENKDLIDR